MDVIKKIEYDLPLELKYEIVKNLSVKQIEKSYPHLLTSKSVLKMLFERDFPLHAKGPYNPEDYEYFENIGKFSLIFGNFMIPLELLEFLYELDMNTNFDLLKALYQMGYDYLKPEYINIFDVMNILRRIEPYPHPSLDKLGKITWNLLHRIIYGEDALDIYIEYHLGSTKLGKKDRFGLPMVVEFIKDLRDGELMKRVAQYYITNYEPELNLENTSKALLFSTWAEWASLEKHLELKIPLEDNSWLKADYSEYPLVDEILPQIRIRLEKRGYHGK